MNICRMLLSSDPYQAMRIKRLIFINNIPYIFTALLIIYALWFDLLPGYPISSIFIIPVVANVVFYGLMRSNLNLRFKEPSLMVPQTVYAIGAYMFVVYFANEVRGVFLMLSLGAPIAIALRLRPRELFWISLLPLLLLAYIIAIQYMLKINSNNLAIDILQWLALAGGISWLSYDGVNLAKKQQERIQNTKKLELTLRENKVLITSLVQQKEIADAASLDSIAKSRLISVASHDLRQPLYALKLFVEQLSGCEDNDKRIQLTQKIESAIICINDLFEDLVDTSKLDKEMSTAKISTFALDPLFKRLENTFYEQAKAKGLRIRFVKTSLFTCSEFILLERILLNLIANALRYTTTGKVLVGCRRYSSNIHIQVWDTGHGIAEDQQHNIFKEFFRIPQNKPSENNGLGLGLSIVEKLCGLLNHEIKLKSTVNRGSCFTVIVPLADTAQQAEEREVSINEKHHIDFNNFPKH
ncbi:MAG: HAMP domain-containing sensor histidine kinase [Pseudomonadota bacterium]